MSFIRKIIGPDETLIGITSAHWIYGATGLAWLAGMMVLGLFLDYYAMGLFDYLFRDTGAFAVNRIADALFWIPTGFGGVMFFLYLLMMIAPEIALTSKRVIYKTGIVFIRVKEVDLEEIKAANVDNGVFGRLFNYGFVVFDARFVQGMDLPAIGKPYRFVKALNDARSKLKQDSMTIVLEGAKDAIKEEIAHDKKVPVKLEGMKYDDHMEQTPIDAARAIAQEGKENARRAIKTSPLEELKRGLDEEGNGKKQPGGPNTEPEPKPQPGPPEEEAGPVVFNNELLNRERELRREIKDSFSTTN